MERDKVQIHCTLGSLLVCLGIHHMPPQPSNPFCCLYHLLVNLIIDFCMLLMSSTGTTFAISNKGSMPLQNIHSSSTQITGTRVATPIRASPIVHNKHPTQWIARQRGHQKFNTTIFYGFHLSEFSHPLKKFDQHRCTALILRIIILRKILFLVTKHWL